ncbi:MAG: hypothetical protein WCK29_00850 [archaeon]
MAKPKDQENNALVEQTTRALQEKYVDALLKQRPGLGGEAAKNIARDLTSTGITPNEAFALMNLVYSPVDVLGRGQATRAKYFSEAVQERYGDVILYNASQNVQSFRRLLGKIGEAVDTRDVVNEQLDKSAITFRDTLMLQDLGIDAETIISYHDILVADYGFSNAAAITRIKKAVLALDNRNTAIGNLESLIFPTEMDSFVSGVMASDSIGEA